VATRVFGLAPTDWRIHAVDSDQAPGEAAALAIDGDPNTLWHSRWNPDSPPHPHFIAIDLGAAHDLSGFTYLPRPDAGNGTIVRYDFEVSDDGATWSSVIADGTFANVKNNPVEQVVMFSAPVRARYVKLVGRSEVNGRAWSSAAEIGVIASDE
ncbi:MAG: discoidin domain-containing protein, partial [Phycisphaerales bacterium]|nr:discoidin domain-containing protein [Phycisphaerales bacterium]